MIVKIAHQELYNSIDQPVLTLIKLFYFRYIEVFLLMSPQLKTFQFNPSSAKEMRIFHKYYFNESENSSSRTLKQHKPACLTMI